MYNMLCNLIKNKFYKDSSEVLDIIMTFYRNDKLNDEEYILLIDLVNQVYELNEEEIFE